ncbi:MAG: glycosidase [Actinobacteria bacterium 21-64-8]|nr:MAG: glycosidase [Actinobacteria bacterium 21-64-8]
MSEISMRRLNLVIEPDPTSPFEVEGILNPAAARAPDGTLYLFARMVAVGNYSRIGILKVHFDSSGDPCGAERVGIALEPEAPYELRGPGAGGCEDPRVTYVACLGTYVMTYTAFSPVGPRVALAISDDLLTWRRLGLASFAPHDDIEFNGVDNKDAVSFPQAIPNPLGRLELAILHRPLFGGTQPEEISELDDGYEPDLHRESIWISYCSMTLASLDAHQLTNFTSHHRLAAPQAPWEELKIGSGTPPVMTRHGWLFIYHGVSEEPVPEGDVARLNYSAGLMVLSKNHPRKILYRSSTPLLVQEPSNQHQVTPSDVVFPTGIDQRVDLDEPDRFDVYFGMNDFRIGVARLDVGEYFCTTETVSQAEHDA